MTAQTESAPAQPSAIDKLIKTAPRGLILGGLLIFFINMALAWVVTFMSNSSIRRPLLSSTADEPSATAMAVSRARDATPNEMFLLQRVVEADLHHRLIANKQTLLVVGMAVCFGLMSIGFALYVLGIRSAFEFSGSAGPSMQVALTSASPGVLCFLLAAIVAVFALTREFKASLGTYYVYPNAQAAVSAEPRPADPPKMRLSAFEAAARKQQEQSGHSVP